MTEIKIEKVESQWIDLIKPDQIKKKYGFVALLDALGVKNSNEEELFEFISNFNLIYSALQHDKLKIFEMYPHLRADYDIDITTFQDTIIITFEVEEKDKLIYLFPFIDIVNYYVANAFANKVMLRGAISYGKFYIINNSYFGEAINDASEWYEELDMIGVMTVPKLTYMIENLVNTYTLDDDLNRNELEQFRTTLINMVVPAKSGKTNTFLINWIVRFACIMPKPEYGVDHRLNAMGRYKAILSQLNIPKSAAKKYSYTTDYAQKVLERNPQYKDLKLQSLEEIEKMGKGE